MELIARPEVTSAPDLPSPLAGFHNLLVYNVLRQSLLRSGAAYTYGELQNLPVLQLAQWYDLA